MARREAGQRARQRQLASQVTPYLDEEDEPLTQLDLEHAARFDERRYGLTHQEALVLVSRSTADYKVLIRKIEGWRETHGFPAQNSPLARGYIRSLLGLQRR